MATLKYLLEKEIKQFMRNAFLPKMVIAYPLMVMLVMPLVTTMDVRNIKMSIVDNDHSSTSQELINKIGASNYFILETLPESYPAALTQVEFGEADVIMEIPKDFEQNIVSGSATEIQISANAVNGSKGSLGSSYLGTIINDFNTELHKKSATAAPAMLQLLVQNRYNQFLDYRIYMIPALMVVLLILLCGLLPALNIVQEKEKGTMEQMNVTPISKTTFILAKLIPYWVMGFIVLTLCFVITWGVYGLVPQGSFITIYAAAALFILIMSGFGLIISNYSATLQQALFVVFFFIMVFMLMSGLFTPTRSMPTWAAWVSAFIPPRYFIEIMRNVYLKGSDFADMYAKFLALGGFALVVNCVAVLSYKKRV